MSTLSLTVHPQRKAVRSGEGGSIFVALVLRAEGAGVEASRADLACALSLDVSGSMGGPPLEMLVASVEKLCELARPTDRIGVVAFSDSATVIAPLTPMDPSGRRTLTSRVRRLQAQGGTNVEDGLRKAAELLAPTDGAARPAILLLSDGQPNRGAASPEALADVVGAQRPRVTVSTLGYGVHHSEDVLVAIADAGAGRFSFIADPAACRRELAAALGAQSDIVAAGVELVLAPAEGIEIKRIVGDPPTRFVRGGVRLALSDMEDRSQRIVALELAYDRPLAVGGHLLDVRLSHTETRAGARVEIALPIVVDVNASGAADDPEGIGFILLSRAEESRRKARALADARNFEGAAATLRAIMGEIVAAPGYVAADGSMLSEAYELLLDEVVAFERAPSSETYSVFRKQTIMQKLDGDGARSVAPVRGATSRLFARTTAGPAKEAHLVVVRGPLLGSAFRLGEACAIGRTAGADIVVPSPSVSRRHAEIYALDAEHWVCDLGSTNATEVNGRKLATAPHKLSAGDVIRVGEVELCYRLGPAP